MNTLKSCISSQGSTKFIWWVEKFSKYCHDYLCISQFILYLYLIRFQFTFLKVNNLFYYVSMIDQGLGNAFDIQGWSGVLQPAVSLKDKGQKITIRNTMESDLSKAVCPSPLISRCNTFWRPCSILIHAYYTVY